MKRWLLCFLIFSCAYLQAGFIEILKRGLHTVSVFNRVERKGFLEITHDILNSDEAHDEVKRAITEQGRRVFLFEYPSHGMKIKGYISFVPECEEENLLFFFRGGSGLYEIKSPSDRTNFWGRHTIISSTYRSGPSPGKDQFGGKDVYDVKHLIDYIPTLEEHLGVSFTKKEKIAVGFSRGGMQMFLSFKQFPELFSYFDKAISVCGVLDLERFIEQNPFIAKLIRYGLWQKMDQHWINQRNPLKNIPSFPKEFPMLIVQGTKDELIDLSIGKTMVTMLQEKECKIDYHEIVGGEHCPYSAGDVVLKWLEKGSPF